MKTRWVSGKEDSIKRKNTVLRCHRKQQQKYSRLVKFSKWVGVKGKERWSKKQTKEPTRTSANSSMYQRTESPNAEANEKYENYLIHLTVSPKKAEVLRVSRPVGQPNVQSCEKNISHRGILAQSSLIEVCGHSCPCCFLLPARPLSISSNRKLSTLLNIYLLNSCCILLLDPPALCVHS